MEPAIHRGDLLLLSNRYSTPLVSGDIVVYKLPGRDVPIVHRIIKVHEQHDTAEVDILTKGDNNLPDDRELYGDRKWLSRDMVVGRAFAFLPRAGMVRGRCGWRERRKHLWMATILGGRTLRATRGCGLIGRIAAAPSVSLLASTCAGRSATRAQFLTCSAMHFRSVSLLVAWLHRVLLSPVLLLSAFPFLLSSTTQLTILMNDYPKLKFALLGGLSLLALVAGD